MDPDPAIFVSTLKTAPHITLGIKVFLRFYFCFMTEGSGSGFVPLTNRSGRPKTCVSGSPTKIMISNHWPCVCFLPEVVQLSGGNRVDHELDLLFSVAPGVGLRLLALALQGALNLRQLGQGSLQALPRVPTETEWDKVNNSYLCTYAPMINMAP